MVRKAAIPTPPPFDPAGPTAAELDPEMYGDTPVEAQFTELPDKEPPMPEPSPIRALVTSAADHHLVVGMATLANMPEAEFQARLALMKQGQDRVEIIQKTLMKEGVDYGKVPGVAKPFLHQPGAETLGNVYGLAVRHEAERIVRKVGDDPGVPPFAYHVKSFVHLGDTSGPIVAEGFGEANPYEDKYHYRWANQGCPVCGKTNTIITRKSPPAMVGKKQCMNYGGKPGCGQVFEANDPRMVPSEKEVVPDSDLFGLGETIIQMATKRSFVAAIRRATGTSGLFTQDEDSPSVQRQSAETGDGDPGAPPPVVENATIGVPIAPGGKTNQATAVQHTRLKVLAMEKGLNGAKIADLLSRLFGMDVEPTGAAASAAAKTLNADQLGQLLLTIETGELPDPTPTSATTTPATPGSTTNPSGANGATNGTPTEQAEATEGPDDIGAK